MIRALALLAVVLLLCVPPYFFSPKSDDELDRLDMRLDPDADNQRRLEETRRAALAVSKFLVPAAVLFVAYAAVVTVLR